MKQRISLKGLLANKNKGLTSKEAPKTQVPPSLPPSPLPSTILGLHANPNLKKKRPLQDLEKGEVALQKGTKQQRTTKDPKDKRATFVESRDDAEVCRQQCTWVPRIELEGAAISWDDSIWESQRGQMAYLTEALVQPLILLGIWRLLSAWSSLISSCL